MVHRAEVTDSDADGVAQFGDERMRPGRGLSVDGQDVEIAHLEGIGNACAWFNRPLMEHQYKVPVRPSFWIARMNHNAPDQTHPFLSHRVHVRVVHKTPRVGKDEFGDEGFAGLDCRLRKPADTVHTARQNDRVPMDRRGDPQPIRYVDADPIAFDGLDSGPRHSTVIPPAIDDKTRRDLMHDLFGDKMKDLDAVNDLVVQGRTVGSEYRRVVLSWLSGRKPVARFIGPGTRRRRVTRHVGRISARVKGCGARREPGTQNRCHAGKHHLPPGQFVGRLETAINLIVAHQWAPSSFADARCTFAPIRSGRSSGARIIKRPMRICSMSERANQ